jgi:hypothetical protein
MLMRKPLRRPLWEQFDLFRPLPPRPTWRTLPKEIRQKVLRLLARLLGTAHSQSAVAAKEVNDE